MQHLIGRVLPDVELPSSSGGFVSPKQVKGRAVYFFYPYTGRPGLPNPRGWDDIVGAHGSTPQALGYAAQFHVFRDLDVSIFGVSLLSQEWIADFVLRNLLPFELLSDDAGRFSQTLKLPRFSIDGVDYLTRLTMIATGGIISHVAFPVADPEKDAANTMELLG